VQLSSIW